MGQTLGGGRESCERGVKGGLVSFWVRLGSSISNKCWDSGRPAPSLLQDWKHINEKDCKSSHPSPSAPRAINKTHFLSVTLSLLAFGHSDCTDVFLAIFGGDVGKPKI